MECTNDKLAVIYFCSEDEDDRYEIVRLTKSVQNKGNFTQIKCFLTPKCILLFLGVKRKATDEAVGVNKKAREN